jgi:hypothetical protein
MDNVIRLPDRKKPPIFNLDDDPRPPGGQSMRLPLWQIEPEEEPSPIRPRFTGVESAPAAA